MASSTADPISSGITTSSTTSSSVTMLDHCTNYVNVHLSIDKLNGTNYDTWSSDIRLWLKSQGYSDVAENEVSHWSKIDAQLCIILKLTIHSSLKQIFRSYETCSEVWEQAKLLYTNDTQHLCTFMEFVKISSRLLLPDVLMVQ